MRILDINGQEITNPDMSLGYLREEQLFVETHPAVEAVEEQGHYETIAEYSNGGKDVEWVVDVPGVEAREAWDEYETIQRYVLYTAEELAALEAERNRPTLESRVETLEADSAEAKEALELILSGVTE